MFESPVRRAARRSARTLAVLTLVVGAIAVGTSQSAIGSPTSASISLSPASLPQGGKTKVIGSGFVAGESVTILLDDVTRATTTASSTGAFKKVFRVPLKTTVGQHTVAAQGDQGSSASAPLTVTAGYRKLVLADHPAVYYRLADTGTTMVDSSGNAHDGAYSTNGNVTHGVKGALRTDSNKAVSSSGGSPVGVFSSASFLPSGNDPRTIEAWYR